MINKIENRSKEDIEKLKGFVEFLDQNKVLKRMAASLSKESFEKLLDSICKIEVPELKKDLEPNMKEMIDSIFKEPSTNDMKDFFDFMFPTETKSTIEKLLDILLHIPEMSSKKDFDPYHLPLRGIPLNLNKDSVCTSTTRPKITKCTLDSINYEFGSIEYLKDMKYIEDLSNLSKITMEINGMVKCITVTSKLNTKLGLQKIIGEELSEGDLFVLTNSDKRLPEMVEFLKSLVKKEKALKIKLEIL